MVHLFSGKDLRSSIKYIKTLNLRGQFQNLYKKTCSSENQLALSYRSVKCVSTDHRGRFRPGNNCDGPRPDKEKKCDVPTCPISWVFSQWSKVDLIFRKNLEADISFSALFRVGLAL